MQIYLYVLFDVQLIMFLHDLTIGDVGYVICLFFFHFLLLVLREVGKSKYKCVEGFKHARPKPQKDNFLIKK